MAKKEAVAETKAAPEKPVKAKEPEAKMVTSRELADQLGTKPTILRRYLRTLPKYQDGGYTRYKWDEKDPFLKDVKASFEKFKTEEKEKNAKRLATLKEKKEKAEKTADPKGAGKKAAKKDREPEPEVDETEEFEDDEPADDGEEELE